MHRICMLKTIQHWWKEFFKDLINGKDDDDHGMEDST